MFMFGAIIHLFLLSPSIGLRVDRTSVSTAGTASDPKDFFALGHGACRNAQGEFLGHPVRDGDEEACSKQCTPGKCDAYAHSASKNKCVIYFGGRYTHAVDSTFLYAKDWKCNARKSPLVPAGFEYIGEGGCRGDDWSVQGYDGKNAQDCSDQCTGHCVAYAHSASADMCYLYTKGPYTKTSATTYKRETDWQCFAASSSSSYRLKGDREIAYATNVPALNWNAIASKVAPKRTKS